MRLFIVDGEIKVAIIAAMDEKEAQKIFEQRFNHTGFDDIIVKEIITPPDQGVLTVLKDDKTDISACSCNGGCHA